MTPRCFSMVLDIGFASFMSGTVPMAGQPSKQINNDFPSKPLQYQKKNVSLHPEMENKHLYIIAGPNGAGKTTASYSVLPKILQCREFVNADEIARGLSPFNPESVAIEAGRLMLSRIAELLRRNESFSIETTLATRSYFKLIEKAHQQGYEVTLLFFWLKTPEQAIERVAERVSKGGHNIPRDIIIRRYYEGIDNLFRIYMPIVDTWILVDNSVTPRGIIATGGMNQKMIINNEVEFKKIEAYVKH